MEKYNEKKMQELFAKSGQSRADFRRGMGNLDDRIAKNYLAGGDLAVSKLLQAAKWFGVKVGVFFEEEGAPNDSMTEANMADAVAGADNARTLLCAERKEHEREIEHMKEVMRLRIGYERQLAALERENELLRAGLEKKPDGADPDSVVYLSGENCNDYYSTKAAEEEG